ncbi:MAG: DHH family phosphoesterase [Clostridia bacterium]|nr:DHH family phosphoesterase [Clostridia bacterium]MBR4979370.1 DHH family phosphoesterase [Clostridia bacterium]
MLKDCLKKMFSKKSVLAGLFALVIFTLACLVKREYPLVFAGIAIIILFLIGNAVITGNEIKKSGMTKESPLLSGMTINFVTSFKNPIAIVNDSGEIVWYNKAFLAISGEKETFYGKKLSEKFGSSLSPARMFRDNAEAVQINAENKEYEVNFYKTSSVGKGHCITVWNDVTPLAAAKKESEMKSLMVAFVVIDNFSEAVQFIQDKQRTALASIGSVLDEWTASIGGIIKEYDKDKFIILFEQRYFEKLDEDKFDILDKIREIEIDNITMPFTASIGVSKIEGTFGEKESVARNALDLALQRGGDQAVVKSENSVEYYGGKSKSVQKKTKVRSRVIANELTGLIKNSGNVIVMGHKYADHDSIASCVAVSRIAKYNGVPVNVVVNVHDFNLKKIFDSMRDKAGEYDELFVDRETAHELIRSDTLLVVCDVNNPTFFEVPELYESASSFVVIDHHRKTGEFVNPPKISYIEPAASSASELMCEILEQSVPAGTLTKPEANLLFAGISLDTNQFTKNTGTKTFGAAQYLRGEGANPYDASKLFSTSIEDFTRETAFENNIHIYKEKIAISVYEKEAQEKDKIAASKAADKLLTLEKVSASFVICVIDGSVHISSRSDGTVNVQLILEKLGGGGHFDSAGAQLDNVTLEEGLIKLKNAIDDYMNENTDA